MADIARIEAQLASLLTINEELKAKVSELERTQTAMQSANTVTVTEYKDIEPTYANGDAIQLDAFKVIPEFNGEKRIYRSWQS